MKLAISLLIANAETIIIRSLHLSPIKYCSKGKKQIVDVKVKTQRICIAMQKDSYCKYECLLDAMC